MKILAVFLSLWLLSLLPAEGWLEKARRYFAEGQYQEALLAYRQAQQAYPRQSAPILYNIAQCYLAMDSTERAMETFTQAVSPQDPGLSAQAYNQIGVLLAQEGKYEQALRFFRRALKSDPGAENAAFNFELVSRLLAIDKPPQEGEGEPNKEKEPDDAPSGSQSEDTLPEDSLEVYPDPSQAPRTDNVQRWQRPSSDDLALNRPQTPISLEEARRLLEAMQENELRFLQQLRKTPVGGKPEEGKPDW